MHYAAFSGSDGIVKLLLSKKADATLTAGVGFLEFARNLTVKVASPSPSPLLHPQPSSLPQWREHSPMYPWFQSRRQRYIWVEFVIGTRLCPQRIFHRIPQFFPLLYHKCKHAFHLCFYDYSNSGLVTLLRLTMCLYCVFPNCFLAGGTTAPAHGL